MEIRKIAHINTGFSQKFGIPRQSGLVDEVGYIVFEKKDVVRHPLVAKIIDKFEKIENK